MEGQSSRSTFLLGLLAASLGAIAYGTGQTLARYVVTGSTTPMAGAVYGIFFGTLVLSIVSARQIRHDLRASRAALGMMGMAGVCSGLGTLFMFLALSKAPITLATPIISLYPMVTLVLTHLLLKRFERVTPRMALACILVLSGVLLVILGRVEP
ncbi:MAG: EamA family transporter [Acidobacteria bacterium]|nr:EamA family transporter [Acidobacteriota bacterium]